MKVGCLRETAPARGEQPCSLPQCPVYRRSSHRTYSAKRLHASAAFPQQAESPVPPKSRDTVCMFQLLLTAPSPRLLPTAHFALCSFTRTNSATSQGTVQPLLSSCSLFSPHKYIILSVAPLVLMAEGGHTGGRMISFQESKPFIFFPKCIMCRG